MISAAMSGTLSVRVRPAKQLGDWRFSTTKGRPLAEPPIFNYEELVREKQIPSDIRLKRLFAQDIGMGYLWRDQMTERILLAQYCSWAHFSVWKETDTARREWYQELNEELLPANRSREDEMENPFTTLNKAFRMDIVSPLGYWEYLNLDEDGGVTSIQQRLGNGEDVFNTSVKKDFNAWHHGTSRPAIDKYGYLVPLHLLAKFKARCKTDEETLAEAEELCRGLFDDEDTVTEPPKSTDLSTKQNSKQRDKVKPIIMQPTIISQASTVLPKISHYTANGERSLITNTFTRKAQGHSIAISLQHTLARYK